MLVAIDPGAKNVGWAVWLASGLEACGLLGAHAARQEDAVWELVDAAKRDILELYGPPHVLCIEKMQVYFGHKAKGDPADLIECSFVGGLLAGVIKAQQLLRPTGHAWKGNAPKQIIHQRVREKLTTREDKVLDLGLAKVPARLRHNVLDAVSLGMWAWQRSSSPL